MKLLVDSAFLVAFYGLSSIGLSLVFGVSGKVNFAHGEIYMLGAFAVWLLTTQASGLSFGLAFATGSVAAVAVGAAAGAAINSGIFRPLRDRALAAFLATYGLSLALQVAVGQIFGLDEKGIPSLFVGVNYVAGTVITDEHLFDIAVAAFVGVALWAFLRFARAGRAVRACAQDRDAAALQGMRPARIEMLTLMIGSALAALAGALIGSDSLIDPYIGTTVILKAFVIVIVGGLGSLPGVLVTSVFFGLMDTAVQTYSNPELVVLLDGVAMLLILTIRPRGLFGRAG